MKNILIVDDEEAFVESLSTGLVNYAHDFLVLKAHNGKQAIQVLESTPVDLMITDLRMPEMDGFELLAYMSVHFPSIPVIVISAFGSARIKEQLDELGAIKYLSKPIDFLTLADEISKDLEQDDKSGSVRGISLGGFLQLIEVEEKTCLLKIQSDKEQKQGFFYFNKGQLYDAIYDTSKGEDAAMEMIQWDGIEISFMNLPKKKIKKRIDREIMGLLMEAMRRKDESGPPDDNHMTASTSLEFDRDTNEPQPATHEMFVNEIEEINENDFIFDDSTEEESLDQPTSTNTITNIPQADQSTVGYQEKASSDLLQEMLEIAGIEAVLIVAEGGLVVESAGSLASMDLEVIGASVAMVLNGAEKMCTELALKDILALTLESDDALLMCTAIGRAVLVITALNSKTIGMIRNHTKKNIAALAKLYA